MYSKFRPCIDLHSGQVKQIVGGTLHEDNEEQLKTNFVSSNPSEYYSRLYRDHDLVGGHAIMLGPGNEQAAASALNAWPEGMQVGGGITADNAQHWISQGASKVIITSWLFPGAKFSLERLQRISEMVGRDRLVVDLSCRRRGEGWVVAMNKWQTMTDMQIKEETLKELALYCSEFLIHAADVEGLCNGIDRELVRVLGEWSTIPVTYAGGASSIDDLRLVNELSAAFYAHWNFTSTDAITLLLVTLTAVIVRCYRLSVPSQVVFDEVHFGKFAGKYINGTYFYDLHPPLAKMMFAAVGRLVGYDGVFDFRSIGLDYNAANVPYVGMRIMPALLGVATVPAAYVTTRACGYKLDTAVLASLLVCFENGLITQSRLILLDSPLIFFTAMSLTTWAMFWTKQREPFSHGWWFWLLLTGFNMGCAASCKWVGLFLFPAIGLSTIGDLWEKIADRSISPTKWFSHFFARAIGLLAVPFAVYMFWFQVHFIVLSKTGDATAMMTPEFQSTLKGGLDIATDRDIYYGSEIRIKHSNTISGYLHSHQHLWKHEKGSGQQQVTIYGHADQNNIWIVEPAFNTTIDTSKGPRLVKSKDMIRLKHKITSVYLHSHNKKPALAPQDENKFEVSGYGFPGFPGDSNDNFIIEVIQNDKAKQGSDEYVQAIYSRFRLLHPGMSCALYNTRQKLPKWAYEQIEVNCMRNVLPRMSTWHVEYAHYPNATEGAVRKAQYKKLSVWGKIWEYNKHMADSNESLTGDHPFAARPQHWPWLRRGTAYWGGRGNLIYQLGNPLVWWASFASVVLFALVRSVLFLLDKRRIHPTFAGQRDKYLAAAGFFTVAWLSHYVPFFLMGRELFIHHYFPALWMAILVLAFTLDLVVAKSPKIIRWSVYVAVFAAVLYAFEVYSYITYARTWDRQVCLKAKWLSTWDFDCEHAVGGVRATDPPPGQKEYDDDEDEANEANDADEDAAAVEDAAADDVGDDVAEEGQQADTAEQDVAPEDSVDEIAEKAEQPQVGKLDIGEAIAIKADQIIEKVNPDAKHVQPEFVSEAASAAQQAEQAEASVLNSIANFVEQQEEQPHHRAPAQRLPQHVVQSIIQHTTGISQISFFTAELQEAKGVTRGILPLLGVCRSWRAASLPLFYQECFTENHPLPLEHEEDGMLYPSTAFVSNFGMGHLARRVNYYIYVQDGPSPDVLYVPMLEAFPFTTHVRFGFKELGEDEEYGFAPRVVSSVANLGTSIGRNFPNSQAIEFVFGSIAKSSNIQAVASLIPGLSVHCRVFSYKSPALFIDPYKCSIIGQLSHLTLDALDVLDVRMGLIHRNSLSLVYLKTTLDTPSSCIELIRDKRSTLYVYPRLAELYLTMPLSIAKDRARISDLVPFPSLRRFWFQGAYPFEGSVLFRGDPNRVERMDITTDLASLEMLRASGVFEENMYPRARHFGISVEDSQLESDSLQFQICALPLRAAPNIESIRVDPGGQGHHLFLNNALLASPGASQIRHLQISSITLCTSDLVYLLVLLPRLEFLDCGLSKACNPDNESNGSIVYSAQDSIADWYQQHTRLRTLRLGDTGGMLIPEILVYLQDVAMLASSLRYVDITARYNKHTRAIFAGQWELVRATPRFCHLPDLSFI
ncbi:hypothetical protein GGI12_002608 [Dipsacomyces acuminosporus]|nr:hypothetical protein GGI12_002608 [Dipsacomyces acuminosporus]